MNTKSEAYFYLTKFNISTMKKLLLFFPILMILLITTACNSQNNPAVESQKNTETVAPTPEPAPKGTYSNVEVDEFRKLIEKGEAVLIDVRTSKEYDQGYIEGAQLIDFYSKDLKAQIAELDKDKTVLVYCRSGKRSSSAMMKMEAAGIKTVYNLSGGILDWIAKGGKVVK
jgi:rhodanese-related sulfurtransferase